jgi:hypothetical protein
MWHHPCRLPAVLRGRLLQRGRWLAVLAMVVAGAAGAQSPARPPASIFGPLPTDIGPITVYVAPPLEGAAARSGDAELARWALEDWGRAARLSFTATDDEENALVRVYFAPPGAGQYGEMMPVLVNGRRGARVFIRPDTEALGMDIADRARADELFRDTIVYLTCLHELGHALGLVHTSEYEDIMYAFGYGGDILEYFDRFRRQLEVRADIARVSGIAQGDRAQLLELYPGSTRER